MTACDKLARSRTEICRADGFTLLDLLVATGVALTTLAIVTAALPPCSTSYRRCPMRPTCSNVPVATEAVLTGLVGGAGAGAGLLGEGPLPQAVPAVWPRRVLTTADRAGVGMGGPAVSAARRGVGRPGAVATDSPLGSTDVM